MLTLPFGRMRSAPNSKSSSSRGRRSRTRINQEPRIRSKEGALAKFATGFVGTQGVSADFLRFHSPGGFDGKLAYIGSNTSLFGCSVPSDHMQRHIYITIALFVSQSCHSTAEQDCLFRVDIMFSK